MNRIKKLIAKWIKKQHESTLKAEKGKNGGSGQIGVRVCVELGKQGD
jgi:hypothetical protein